MILGKIGSFDIRWAKGYAVRDNRAATTDLWPTFVSNIAVSDWGGVLYAATHGEIMDFVSGRLEKNMIVAYNTGSGEVLWSRVMGDGN